MREEDGRWRSDFARCAAFGEIGGNYRLCLAQALHLLRPSICQGKRSNGYDDRLDRQTTKRGWLPRRYARLG